MKTRRLTTIPVLIMAVLSMQLAAYGATYYVATTGSDANPGTSAQPWQTIQFAVDAIAPGDTILVKDGTYVGARIENSGLPGTPKTLQAENRGKVKLNALSATSRHGSILEIENFDTPIGYWVVDGFEVDGMSANGGVDIRGIAGDPSTDAIPANGITIRYCHVHHAQHGSKKSTGLFDGSHSNPLYEFNELDHNTEHGVYHSNSSVGGTLRGNISHNNAGCGFHNNGDVSLGTPGVITGVLYEKNIAYGNGAGIGTSFTGGGAAINLSAESNSLYKNNLMYNNHASGMTFYIGEGTQASSYDHVYNNTIAMPADGRFAVLLGDGARDNTFQNNILYNANPAKGSYTISSPAQLNFVSNFNIVCNDRFNIDGDASTDTISFAQWQNLSQQGSTFDPNSIPVAIGDDSLLFTNPAAGDYSLKPGSLAIDSGFTLSEVGEDINGGSRPAGARYDIGAYEFGSQARPTVAAPQFMPPGGVYPLPLKVALYCSTGGAQIRYTLDGGTPDETSELYTGPLDVQTAVVINAKAFAKGYVSSPAVEATYLLGNVVTLDDTNGVNGVSGWVDSWLTSGAPDTPQYDEAVFELQTPVPDRQVYKFDTTWIPGGATILTAELLVNVRDVSFAGTASDTIPSIAAFQILKPWSHTEVTYNSAATGVPWGQAGLQPDVDFVSAETGRSQPLYQHASGFVSVDIRSAVEQWYKDPNTNQGVMLQLMGEGALTTDSTKTPNTSAMPHAHYSYVLSQPVYYAQTPTLAPGEGNYAGSVDVTMSSGTRPSEIRYTTDGTEPTEFSTLYVEGEPVHLTETTTIKARTYAPGRDGYVPSAAISQTYTFVSALEPPVFSPAPASYNSGLEVTITSPVGGVEIHYTIDGTEPTASSPLYSSPIIVASNMVIKAVCTQGELVSDVAVGPYRIDMQAPAIPSLATVPDVVRVTIDTRITVTALASDFGLGDSRIVAAECYTDPATPPGAGTAMTPDDGIFDNPLEHVTGTLDCSTWPLGPTTVFVRAEDEAGNWSDPASIDVSVVSATPPGTIRDLLVTPSQDYILYYMSQEQLQVSSESPQQPATNLIDGNHSSTWQTDGNGTDEWAVLDISNPAAPGPVVLGGLALIPGPSVALFPTQFAIWVSMDGIDWGTTPVAYAEGLKVRPGQRYLWEFTPVEAQFVKISGPGILAKDGKRYWQIADIEAVRSASVSDVTVKWTAPADDGYSGAACRLYNLRYAKVESTATSLNFDAATLVTGLPAPAAPATQESFATSLAPVGRIFMAIKSMDSAGNWSAISNLAAAVVGKWRILSDPIEEEPSATRPSDFRFAIGTGVKGAVLAASGSNGFPTGPTSAAVGGSQTVRLPIKPGSAAWTPKTSQWRKIKSVALPDNTDQWRVYWRIEGKAVIYRTPTTVFGPAQAIYFNTGTIPGLTINISQDAESGPVTISAATTTRPLFGWQGGLTNGMARFFIDVSTASSFPLSDRTRTTLLGGTGIRSLNSYTPTATEWSRMRRLAATNGQTLYWRVRAVDKDKALKCISHTGTLILSNGQ